MPDERKLRLEIAHVLFIDIVGYSKLLISEQSELLEQLKEIVRHSAEAQAADSEGKLIRLATGDGMALVFRNSPEAPVQCALELSRADKANAKLQLRMGIHSGPINEITDVNDRANVTGAGINMAQRVMDCGDAGHILLSQHVADDLEQYGQWRPLLHALGECEVKHGVKLQVVNLYNDEVGNPELPEKFRQVAEQQPIDSLPVAVGDSKPTRNRLGVVIGTVLVIGSLLAIAVISLRRPAPSTVGTNAPAAAPTPAATAPAISEKSVAVLPFENLSEEKANAFFADGVQDEILTDLAKIADLKVISRTSVMQYKAGIVRNLRKVAEELGVAHVLEGSVQRANNRVRVNAQLIDARTDAHLWAQTYDRELADVFAIQSEIAETIAQQLQAHLSSREKADIQKPATTDVVANDLFIRGWKLGELSNDPGGKTSLLESLALLAEAVRRDPKFTRAYCRICETNLDLYWGGFDHSDARRELARVALEHAEALEPDSGDVHLEKGTYAYHGFRDYDRARAELELARRLIPNSSKVYMQIGAIDRRQGRFDEAIRNFDRAVELDPRNLVNVQEAGFTREGMRRYPEARIVLQKALALSPKDFFVRAELSQISFYEKADTGPWRAELDEILGEGKEAAAHIGYAFANYALATRDHDAAARALTIIPPEGAINPYDNSLMPREWFAGLFARSFGDNRDADTAFNAARQIVQPMIQQQPDYAAAWILLGMIEAGLGHKAEAIAAGERGYELLPVEKDAWDAATHLTELAIIYAWLGEKDQALERLAKSARIGGGTSYGELKLMPVWDSLRGDARFEKIVADLAPKQSK